MRKGRKEKLKLVYREKGGIMKNNRNDPDMQKEYDFSKGVRGKYAEKYAEGANVVVIEPDIAKYFPDQEAVNDALRSIVDIIEKREKMHRKADTQIDG